MREASDLSGDQRAAFAALSARLAAAGVDLAAGLARDRQGAPVPPVAILGRAGTGKTLLLARLAAALARAGLRPVAPDWEGRRRQERRSFAILAPTNKAAAVLRARGVPATTIHRILYTPVYDPRFEEIAAWLAGEGKRPALEGIAEAALDRAQAFFAEVGSIPAALAVMGLRGTDFITGWKRREAPLDIGLVDEASMLDARLLEDLRAIFPTLFLFGDPAQLPPVGDRGTMVFYSLPERDRLRLEDVHRQAADSPILDLALALGDPGLDFAAFEAMVAAAARRDGRVLVSPRADADLMARAPMLVWRNQTRIRLIQAFRAAHGAPAEALLPGEPLICDGLELPARHRKRRMELEARGLIKGTQAIYLGPGRKPGFARLHLVGAIEPRIGVAAIVKIERPDTAEPLIASAATMGAAFLHGAAVTIHKAQGSQWPVAQVFAPDLWAAARSGREEAGLPLWQRLAYVAITRAEERLVWVTRPALAPPTRPLDTGDLALPAPLLALAAPEA